jgi:hypothetical protein
LKGGGKRGREGGGEREGEGGGEEGEGREKGLTET